MPVFCLPGEVQTPRIFRKCSFVQENGVALVFRVTKFWYFGCFYLHATVEIRIFGCGPLIKCAGWAISQRRKCFFLCGHRLHVLRWCLFWLRQLFSFPTCWGRTIPSLLPGSHMRAASFQKAQLVCVFRCANQSVPHEDWHPRCNLCIEIGAGIAWRGRSPLRERKRKTFFQSSGSTGAS